MRLVWHTNVISPNLLTKIAHFILQLINENEEISKLV